MSSNWVSTEHVSIVVFVLWAKTCYWTAVWSGTCRSPQSVWLKIWCFFKVERLWTCQNLKGRIHHWLFWRKRWYWIIYLIKQITTLRAWLLIVAYVSWRFWPFVFGSYGVIQVSSVVTVYVPEFGLHQQSCWGVARVLSALVLLTVHIFAHRSSCSYLTD